MKKWRVIQNELIKLFHVFGSVKLYPVVPRSFLLNLRINGTIMPAGVEVGMGGRRSRVQDPCGEVLETGLRRFYNDVYIAESD